ncbi:unnamed protein product, partial [Ixodes pacificus]
MSSALRVQKYTHCACAVPTNAVPVLLACITHSRNETEYLRNLDDEALDGGPVDVRAFPATHLVEQREHQPARGVGRARREQVAPGLEEAADERTHPADQSQGTAALGRRFPASSALQCCVPRTHLRDSPPPHRTTVNARARSARSPPEKHRRATPFPSHYVSRHHRVRRSRRSLEPSSHHLKVRRVVAWFDLVFEKQNPPFPAPF